MKKYGKKLRSVKWFVLIVIALGVLIDGAARNQPISSIDASAQLDAIRLKENSHGKVGKYGERGDYQMMPANVRKYGGYEREHAMLMLQDIIVELEKRGVEASSFNCALAWNAGWPNALSGKAPVVSYRYALDVRRIYNRLTAPSFWPAP